MSLVKQACLELREFKQALDSNEQLRARNSLRAIFKRLVPGYRRVNECRKGRKMEIMHVAIRFNAPIAELEELLHALSLFINTGAKRINRKTRVDGYVLLINRDDSNWRVSVDVCF